MDFYIVVVQYFVIFNPNPTTDLKENLNMKNKMKQASSAVVQRGPNQASHDAVLLFHPGLRAPLIFSTNQVINPGFLIEVRLVQKLGSAAGCKSVSMINIL